MKKLAPFLIILAAFLWSLDGVLRRELRVIPPAYLVMLEHLVGVVFLIPFLPRVLADYRQMSLRNWLLLFTVSVLGGLLGTVLYTAALAEVDYIKYTVVVLLQHTQPIFAVVLARFILGEKLTRSYLLLAAIGLTAAYFLSFPQYHPNLLGRAGEFWAAFFALGAAMCWGTATVLGKLVLKEVNFITVTFSRFLIVIPTAWLTSLLLQQHYSFAAITSSQWLYLVGIAFSAGALAMLIYYKGLEYVPAKVSTLLELSFPVFAVFLGILFFQEWLTLVQALAGAVLLGVIVLLAWLQERKQLD